MSEISINLDGLNPVDLFGINNDKLTLIKKSFPRLRITSRGNKIKGTGTDEELEDFHEKMIRMMEILEKKGKLTEFNIEQILGNDFTGNVEMDGFKSDVLVHGTHGTIVRARTPNQKVMVNRSQKDDVVFAIGPAGTGKTYTAVALAVRALKNKLVKKIVLTRPAVEAGENLGFLPGDLKEKIDPYLRPLYDALDDMIPYDKLNFYMKTRVIEIAPLAFMRGRTLDHSFIILDEAQNATDVQLKMFLTRLGPSARCIVTGDLTQVDLPRYQKSGLFKALKILEGIGGISTVFLNEKDVIRHKLVKQIISAYEKKEHPPETTEEET